jgi:hypothetical protein
MMIKKSVSGLIIALVSIGIISECLDSDSTSGRGTAMSGERETVQRLEPEQTPQEEKSPGNGGVAPFYTPFSPAEKKMPQEGFKDSVGAHDFLTEEESSGYKEYATKAAAAWRALREDDIRSLEGLLDKGVDVDESDSEDLTLLHHAACLGQTKIAQLLLTRGADANARNLYGYTPLMFAAESGHVDIAKLLLAGGADVHVETSIHDKSKSSATLTAMKLAMDNSHTDIVELLKQAGASR